MKKDFFDDWFNNLGPKEQGLVIAILAVSLVVVAYNQVATDDLIRLLPMIYLFTTGKSLGKS